jgi:hypothetical protein
MRSWLIIILFLFPFIVSGQTATIVSGRVIDGMTGQPLSGISVVLTGSTMGTITDKEGKFTLTVRGPFNQVNFSYVGYKRVTKLIEPGQRNDLLIKLYSSDTELQEVSISSGKSQRYRNKGNPAVELIQQIIDHKVQNRMESSDYLQYDQYERASLSMFNISPKLTGASWFKKYKFMLDTGIINGKTETFLPGYLSEKISQHFYRKEPEKTIQILQAEKSINIVKFLDTVGMDIYINRLYGNTIDIYENNIFIINRQFLSPIANHSPNYYKFFITDTIQTEKGKMVELSFTPRAKGDLLFEGKLLVSLNGQYAVTACVLNVNKDININFMRSLQVRLDFEPYNGGRYLLTKSNVKADFGLLKNRGMAVLGERTVVYTNYQFNTHLPEDFYQGKELQIAENADKTDTTYWRLHRTDTLTHQQVGAYKRISRLEQMRSFKTATWIAATFTTDFADLGKVEAGPVGALFSYNSQEGGRFQVGGRTTPEFNSTFYLDGNVGYGTRDKQLKYELSTIFALNKVAPYRFPNDYFKVTYLYDADIPGQSFAVSNSQAALASIQSGSTNYWLYDRIFSVGYVKDFEDHFSYNVSYRNWNQQAAGSLFFRRNDAAGTLVPDLTTQQITVGLRYAPHEQFIQGSRDRTSIKNKYPIFNLQITQGFAGYNYTNITARINKRMFMSQLGYADVTLMGSLLAGKVPFPLLNISPANQSIAYDSYAYNKMYYLEFVSDHYVGLNYTHSFNGFFLNKIPLIKHLKLREYLSFKALYGGLRKENDPAYSQGLYVFPTGNANANGTYALGSTPYFEAGAGLGNIFKILRVDLIRRFNYLDHSGVSPYGVKFSFNFRL